MIRSKAVLTFVLSALMLITSFVLPTCANARQESDLGQFMNSSSISFQVKQLLLKEPGIKSMQIKVNTFKDTVTLSGTVDNDYQKERAADVASQVRGVRFVVDNLVVRG